MTINKNAKGLWDAQWYTKDFSGKNIKHHKRNFKSKREAVEYVNEFNRKAANSSDITFKSLYEDYMKDMETRLEASTIENKKYIIELKLLPYFGDKKIIDITPTDIRHWQNEMIKKGYKPTYLKSINNQLVAMMNYAHRFKNLRDNPCTRAGSMGEHDADEMEFYTYDEFQLFVEALKDKPTSYYAMQTLYWTGIRIGELLGLNIDDVDFEDNTITIEKSFRRTKGQDYMTSGKTKNSKRKIIMPKNLADMLKEYMSMLYGPRRTDKLFMCSKGFLEKEMIRGAKLSGVKKIRVHDLRHSQASLLISELKVDPLEASRRLGHSKPSITLNTYAHMFPNKGAEVADRMYEYTKSKKEDKK